MSALRKMIDDSVDEARRRFDESQRANGPQVFNIHTNARPTSPPQGAGAPTDGPESDADADPYDTSLLGQIVDWPTFWQRKDTDASWIVEPVLAEGRAHAIFAPGGTGKSLFVLWMAAALATGRAGLDGHPMPGRTVLYLDYEMTADDLAERLVAMGYDETCDLSSLHYALLPSLPPADAPEGGKAIARMAQLVGADLVILDTFSRAVSGDENDADTVRDFYRWTGIHLKAEGRAFLRIDHAGKDVDKGQRGTSAKNDDVDVVWKMTKADVGGFKLTANKRRMGWVPETLALAQFDAPNLHYKLADDLAPLGTEKVVSDLDALKVPPSVSARKAAVVLKEAGLGARDALIRAAQKQRMRRQIPVVHPVDNSPKPRPRIADAEKVSDRDAARDAVGENAHLAGTDAVGTRWDAVPDAGGTRSVSLIRTRPALPSEDVHNESTSTVEVDW